MCYCLVGYYSLMMSVILCATTIPLCELCVIFPALVIIIIIIIHTYIYILKML